MHEGDFSLDPDVVADCVLDTFDALPAKFKPRTLVDSRREWVTLAGIVVHKNDVSASPFINGTPVYKQTSLVAPHDKNKSDEDNAIKGQKIEQRKHSRKIICAALATGVKCLSREKLAQAKGNVLHDSHAEILAIRAFNRWLVDACGDLARRGLHGEHEWVRWRAAGGDDGCGSALHGAADGSDGRPPFEIKHDVGIHMYVSEAPCGDASMELVMAEQEDPTPWPTSSPRFMSSLHSSPSSAPDHNLLGRGQFNQLGVVRRKPSRRDAPTSWSKSCSDKLAMKQCIGLTSGLTANLVEPESAYLTSLVLPVSQLVPLACERAFGAGGRMKRILAQNIQARWKSEGYSWSPFAVRATRRDFTFSKRAQSLAVSVDKAIPSNLSALYTPDRREILINGVLQGRKIFDPRGSSCVSRRAMWRGVVEVAMAAGLPALAARLSKSGSYVEAKQLKGRDEVKASVKHLALKGWRQNEGDDAWNLEE